MLTLSVVPGTGDWVVATEPDCPVRPESGNCAAVVLPPDGGGGKFDLEFVSSPERGRQAGAGVVLADADRLQDFDGVARDILAFAPGFLNQQKTGL